MTDPSGNIADTYRYDGYGIPISATNTYYNPHRYGGKYGYHSNLNPTGVILAGHRWYSPQLRRWMSRDPIAYQGGENLYAYVKSNPIRFVDPAGTDWLDSLSDFSAGFGDEISFDLTKWVREELNNGIDPANNSSPSYRSGGWAGFGFNCLGFAVGGAEALGYRTVVRRYPNAGGGGLTILEKSTGKRTVSLDWHAIGKPPNQRFLPHVDTRKFKHWPWK